MKTIISVLALVVSVPLAYCQSYNAILTPEADGGGARTGSGIVNLTLDGTTLTLSGSFSGLSANSSGAHIHGPQANPFPQTASVIYDFSALGLTTLGSTSGTINGTIALVPKGTGGSYTVAQQVSDLNNGMWYINIHSTGQFAGGEIRGQILPVPEPSTIALAGLGLAGMIGLGIRRRFRA